MLQQRLFSIMAAVCLFISSSIANGQTDFFLSFQPLNQGAVNSNATGTFSPGETGTLFLYYTTNGPADSNIDTGAFVDLLTSESGTIQFTAAETLDFNISLLGNVLGPRWGDAFGATATVTDDLVDELNAFTIFSGLGIDEGNNGSAGLLDEGYDLGADAFLFATIDFVVTENPVAESVDVTMQTGLGGIVNNGMFVNATFGTATIEVSSGPLMGDVNLDGVVDMGDVSPFIQVIINGPYQIEADINEDGSVDLLDVRPFVDLL